MNSVATPIKILIADDDADDRLMVKEALEEARVANGLVFVEHGVELMDYLRKRGKYSGLQEPFLPGLLLLDLNMPRMDGREVLKELKSDPDLRRIPVVALTTSKAEEDILQSYDLGVSSFITKPVSFDGLVEAMRSVTDYWLQIVQLPPR